MGGLNWIGRTVLVPTSDALRRAWPRSALFDPHHHHHSQPLIFVVIANAAAISGDAQKEALLQIS